MKTRLPVLVLWMLLLVPVRSAEAPLPEPGPEAGGLRLRLRVTPRADQEGYDVGVDLLNVSAKPVTVRADWRNDQNDGGVKDYLEASASIEIVPEVQRWMGGVAMGQRTTPQPEQVLAAGATLSLSWQTAGRYLKKRISDPHEARNPTFPFPGLYAVHATLLVVTPGCTVPLRSNEQLVPVAGSLAMPKSTLGRLMEVDADGKGAVITLGSRHQAAVGDQFEHRSKTEDWRFTVTRVGEDCSWGSLELMFPKAPMPPRPGMEFVLKPKP